MHSVVCSRCRLTVASSRATLQPTLPARLLLNCLTTAQQNQRPRFYFRLRVRAHAPLARRIVARRLNLQPANTVARRHLLQRRRAYPLAWQLAWLHSRRSVRHGKQPPLLSRQPSCLAPPHRVRRRPMVPLRQRRQLHPGQRLHHNRHVRSHRRRLDARVRRHIPSLRPQWRRPPLQRVQRSTAALHRACSSSQGQDEAPMASRRAHPMPPPRASHKRGVPFSATRGESTALPRRRVGPPVITSLCSSRRERRRASRFATAR